MTLENTNAHTRNGHGSRLLGHDRLHRINLALLDDCRNADWCETEMNMDHVALEHGASKVSAFQGQPRASRDTLR